MKKNQSTQKTQKWEHLEHTLKKTTYAMRLKWLEQAQKFARKAAKAKHKSA